MTAAHPTAELLDSFKKLLKSSAASKKDLLNFTDHPKSFRSI
jgi:hypothetical protein